MLARVVSGFPLVAAAVAVLVGTTGVQSQVPDHLKCYKVKDPLKLAGTVDADTAQFGADPGCTISKAKLFCVPATKTNVNVIDKATGNPITPLPVTGPDPGDRICYKLKCPALPPDQEVTDQFGTRTLGKFKSSLLCTPAVKGQIATTTTPSTTSTTTTTQPLSCGLQGSECNGACPSETTCLWDPLRRNCFCLPGIWACTATPYPQCQIGYCIRDNDGCTGIPGYCGCMPF